MDKSINKPDLWISINGIRAFQKSINRIMDIHKSNYGYP